MYGIIYSHIIFPLNIGGVYLIPILEQQYIKGIEFGDLKLMALASRRTK